MPVRQAAVQCLGMMMLWMPEDKSENVGKVVLATQHSNLFLSLIKKRRIEFDSQESLLYFCNPIWASCGLKKEDFARVWAAHTGYVAYIRSSGDIILLLAGGCLGNPHDQGQILEKVSRLDEASVRVHRCGSSTQALGSITSFPMQKQNTCMLLRN